MARDLPHDEVHQEDNLLIEAVSLLVQRQRETENWLNQQMSHAEERSAAVERRYSDLEARLLGIEDQLDRLVRELEPGRGDPAADQRLARLREQVEDLRSDTDGRPPAQRPEPAPLEAPPVSTDAPAYAAAPPPPPVSAGAPVPGYRGASVNGAGLLEMMGPRPRDRWGLVLMAIGLLAVFYAILTQLRVG